MKRKKKIVIEPAGNNLKEFQGKYAGEFKKIVDNPAYQAGLQCLRNRKLDQLLNLGPDQIEQFSKQLIGELRGYLQHENELLRLHELTDFTLPFDEPEVYLSPEQVAETEKQIEKFQEENRRQRYG